MKLHLLCWGFRRKWSRPLTTKALTQSFQRTLSSPRKIQRQISVNPKGIVFKTFQHVTLRRSHLKYRARLGNYATRLTNATDWYLKCTMRCHGQVLLFARSYSTVSLTRNIFGVASHPENPRQSLLHSKSIGFSDSLSYQLYSSRVGPEDSTHQVNHNCSSPGYDHADSYHNSHERDFTEKVGLLNNNTTSLNCVRQNAADTVDPITRPMRKNLEADSSDRLVNNLRNNISHSSQIESDSLRRNVGPSSTTFLFRKKYKSLRETSSSVKDDEYPSLIRSNPVRKITSNLVETSQQFKRSPSIFHQIRLAMNLKNHIQLDILWKDAATWSVQNQESSDTVVNRAKVLSLEVCNQFITAYMKFQRPSKAIEIWNHMIQNGLEPSLKTWNSMMSGCRMVSDWRSSEKLWNKMIQSGTLPDEVSWSTRISIFAEAKEIDMAIRTLEEMGRLWLAAAKKKHPQLGHEELQLVDDVKTMVKPNVSCLNPIVSGLVRLGKKTEANQLITWARAFGIKPDIFTFNIFLRSMIRNAQRQEAMMLLKRMERAGVEADVVTYTILLDEILRFPHRYTPEQQKKIVEGILEDMSQAGVKPSISIYGKIIHQLTRNHDPLNMPTIQALLQQISAENLKLSIQIQTNLLDYYYLQVPPQHKLAQQIIAGAEEIVGLDRVFWDRAIECCALIGDTSTALEIIARLSSQKTRVGWGAMRKILEALVSRGEKQIAKTLVRDTRTNAGLSDFVQNTTGEAMFWELVEQFDLESPL
ncbi:unnamed protein product [Blumeria hordei]|uniref:Pentatricopeptide repeat-containing protein n=1 Tax=Blumeria hordei TaxID=2867405 RepID=A0A383UXX1_BLUHO|nr:unnamed protein product [Blumeria hordei]